MNKKLAASTSLLLALLCVSLVGSAFAQISVAVGVSQGDSFKYDLTYLWSSTSRADVVPISEVIKNQTDYFQVNVDAAAGNALRLSTVWRFLNGSEVTGIALEDVGNNTSTGFIYIYAANISSGGYLFPLATDLPFIINNTLFRTYENNEFRATNHIEVNRTDLSDRAYSYMDLYFDKQSGVLVEATLKEVYTNLPREIYTTKISLTSSSLWSISALPTNAVSSSPLTTSIPSQTATSPAATQGSGTSASSGLDAILIVLVVIFVVIVVVILFILIRRPKKNATPRPAKTKKSAQTPPSTPGSSSMVRCSKCGYDNPEANEFCGKCGARMNE